MAQTEKIGLKAIIARLKAVSGVTNLVAQRIYSDVPQNPVFPYIVVDISSTAFATKDTSDQDHEILVHAFDRKNNSPDTVLDIKKQIFDALDRKESNFSLDSGYLTLFQFNGLSDTFKEADGITWHGVQGFRMLIT